MLAAPAQDWNVFQQIVVEHWDGCKHVDPRYHQPYYEGLVDQRLGGGNPENMGYRAYRCLHWGQGTHRVAMRCQASLCLRGAQVDVDPWVSPVSRRRHAGVIYRHMVLTVPALLRQTFDQPSTDVWSPFRRGGVRCLDEVFSRVSGRTLPGGDIVVVQRHGRHGQYTPHLHVLAPSGGGEQAAQPWRHLDDGP